MGSKLILTNKDDFLEDGEDGSDEGGGEVSGIVGGCYCCSQNIHVTFNHLEAAPVAQIEDSYFYIIICDQCEEDILFLKENGVDKISYDILWLIQENLATELYNIATKEGEVNMDVREKILLRLYREAEKKIDNKSPSKYLSKFAFKDDDGKKNKN